MCLGHLVMMAGAKGHLALADLGLCIAPYLAIHERRSRLIKPWAGLLVVLLFAFSMAFIGQGLTWAIHEARQRLEVQP